MSVVSSEALASDIADQTAIAPHHRQQIRLRVGERTFYTTKQTLTSESVFFASLLSGRWSDGEATGSCFVDADPALFEHVLRYLRHSVFPIFYDGEKGHDHGLYVAILGEARYFGIPRLEKWLEEKKYVEAVLLRYTVETFQGPQVIGLPKTVSSDTRFEIDLFWEKKKTYVCPRGIPVHRGDCSRCGRQCKEARGDDPKEYDEELSPRIVRIKTEVIVDSSICF